MIRGADHASDEELTRRMSWGVKRSLVSYVAKLPDGSFSTAAGATMDSERHEFAFEYAGYSWTTDDDEFTAKYRGILEIRGHGTMLHIVVIDPWIVFKGEAVHLTVAADADSAERIQFAKLLISSPPETGDGLNQWAAIPARLTEDGGYLLGPQYFEGQMLDPVTFCVPSQPSTS